jgi:hypothetical protein
LHARFGFYVPPPLLQFSYHTPQGRFSSAVGGHYHANEQQNDEQRDHGEDLP